MTTADTGGFEGNSEAQAPAEAQAAAEAQVDKIITSDHGVVDNCHRYNFPDLTADSPSTACIFMDTDGCLVVINRCRIVRGTMRME